MAKSVKALITPEVLKWVRERRIKVTLAYAAERLRVKPEQLEAWENDRDLPSFAQLKKIARLYKTHISIFYLPKPPTDFQPLTDFRVLPGSSAPDEEQTYRLNANIVETYERRERLIELYELLGESPTRVTLNFNINTDPKQAAQKITKFLEFDRKQLQQEKDKYAALKFWKRIVEAKEILVCQTSVNPHLSVERKTMRGFCISETPFPIIVINPKDNPYSRIFTITHELVHLAIGKSVIQNSHFEEANINKRNRIESFCNKVAAEVLLPEDELLEEVKLETLERDLPKISRYFHVNPAAIMCRLLSLKLISQHSYQTFTNEQHKKYDSTSNDNKDVPTKYYKRLLNASGEYFARIAFTAYYDDRITLAELSSAYSNCATKHLRAIWSEIST